jgi:hypothetical protein
MKVIPETRSTHKNWYLRFYFYYLWKNSNPEEHRKGFIFFAIKMALSQWAMNNAPMRYLAKKNIDRYMYEIKYDIIIRQHLIG